MAQLKQHFHLMGISGIGMSAIAKVLHNQGHIISGCDTGIDNNHINELAKFGCKISPQHQTGVCNDPTIDTIVHTSAISSDHPELIQAHKQNINILLRADILAQIMKNKDAIAIAGSHGKTSTSALMGHVLLKANLDPTIIVGGHINSINSNAYAGNSNYVVVEADESDRSLLKLPKQYSIITNIDLEHLETYKNLDDIKQTFTTFINDTPTSGHSILCIDSQEVQRIIPNIKTSYSTYGQSKQADIQPINIQLNTDSSTFDIYQKTSNSILGSITIPQAGIHYVFNTTAVITLSLHLGISFTTLQQTINTFIGVDRRFSYKGTSKCHQTHIFDDYSHHPLEIDYALTIARKKAQNKLIVVFQPHRYSRTKHLWNDFVTTFAQSNIDTLIITDIYPASEQPIDTINSNRLVTAIKQQNPHKNVIYCPIDPQLERIQQIIEQKTNNNDLLLLLGAGKINKLAEKLIS